MNSRNVDGLDWVERAEQALTQVPLFSGLDGVVCREIVSQGRLQCVSRGAVVVTEGDAPKGLYLVLSGRLKVFLNDDAGREVVLTIEESGSAFGEISLLDEEPRSASVAAIEPCELVVIGKEALLDLLRQNPELSLAMIRSLAALVRRLSGNIRTLALKNIYSRLIHLLESRAQQEGDHRVIHERLTHQLMADMIGASREMVSRIMSDLSKGGYIETSRESICIKRRLPSGW